MIRSTLRRLTGRRWPEVRPGEELSCREVGRLLQSYLDEELDHPDEVAALAGHLDQCRACGLEAETYRRIKAAIEEQRDELPADSVARLREFGERLLEG